MEENKKATIMVALYIALAIYIFWAAYPLYWYHKVFGICGSGLLFFLAFKTVVDYRKGKF